MPCDDTEDAVIASVPGHDGPIALERDDEEWIREVADLVDSLAGSSADELDDVGRGFLRGRVISWFELSLDLDVVPRVPTDLIERVSEDLTARDTRRIALLHHPGAGRNDLGATSRLGDTPRVPDALLPLYCASIHDEIGLAQRVGRLAQLTGLPVLLVVEQTTDVKADRLYNRLRADSIPAVVVVVSRRVDEPRDSGSRSFYLGPAVEGMTG